MKRGALLAAAGGLFGWAAAFSSVYGLHGLGCAMGWEHIDLGPLSLQRTVLVVSWLAWLALLALWVWRVRSWRRHADLASPTTATPLLLRLAEMSAWTGLLATLVSLLPTATHALCL